MDKGMRKANKRLEYSKGCVDRAYKRIRKMEQLKNAESEPKQELKAEPEPTIVTRAKPHDFEIVKIQKGLFKVEMDGKIVPKNFKSTTKAKEWILKQ